MIIVPEIQTVIILVPRTGSGSLRRAVAERYPKSMMIYRHMEADGIPLGYDRWRRLGVVRHPIDRLWSLYKFLQKFDGPYEEVYIAAQRASVAMPFWEWIIKNETVFTSPYDSAGLGRFWPQYSVRHPLPETRKSQYLYLRPDLGTEIYRYEENESLWCSLDLSPCVEFINKTGDEKVSWEDTITEAAYDHLIRFFRWDFDLSTQAS